MVLALAVGLFIGLVGLVGVVAPHVLETVSRYTLSPVRLSVAAVLRILIGVVLLRSASASRAPLALRTFGAVAITAGIAFLFMPTDVAKRIVDWWVGQGPVLMRLWPAIALVAGIVVVWATIPERRAT